MLRRHFSLLLVSLLGLFLANSALFEARAEESLGLFNTLPVPRMTHGAELLILLVFTKSYVISVTRVSARHSVETLYTCPAVNSFCQINAMA
jgi:hypothetical protein